MTNFMLNSGMFIQPKHVPPSAWIGHIPFAGWLIEVLRPSILVELGTHQGTSYLALCQAVAESAVSAKCFAVDTWEGDEHAGAYTDEIFTQLHQYHQANYSGFSNLMRMTFDEAANYFDDTTIDLLHIDGLHTYEAVKHDFETWFPKLSDRAIVLFHDTCVRERGFGVWEFWAEVRNRFPSFEFTHTHGLGVLAVGQQAHRIIEMLNGGDSTAGLQITRLFERLGRETVSRADIEFLRNALNNGERHIDSLGRKIAELECVVAERNSQLTAREQSVGQLASSIDAFRRESGEWFSNINDRMANIISEMDLARQQLARTEQERDRAIADFTEIRAYAERVRPWYRILWERWNR